MRRFAFYPSQVSDLMQYLTQPDADKGRILIREYPVQFRQWLTTLPGQTVVEEVGGTTAQDLSDPDAYWDEALSDLADDVTEEVAIGFQHAVAENLSWSLQPGLDEEGEEIEDDYDSPISWGSERARGRYPLGDPRSPTFMHMEYAGDVKNQWLVHFTQDAYKIANGGFTRGIDDPTMIGVTTRDEVEQLKAGGGYNFAYQLHDYIRHGRYSYDDVDALELTHPWKYGPEAVLFRASGILAYHEADNEPQVIFWGESADTIIPVTAPLFSCLTDRVLVDTKLIEESIAWIVTNFRQYRNHLLCRHYDVPDEVYLEREEREMRENERHNRGW